MTIETDTLKTLLRIESLLEKSAGVVAGGGGDVTERRRVKVAGGKKEEGADFKELNDGIFRATKKLDSLGQQSDKLGKSIQGARGDLVSMRSGVRGVGTSLSSLNTAIADVVKSMSTLDSTGSDGTTDSAPILGGVAEASKGVRSEFLVLVRMTKVLNANFERLATSVIKSVIPSDVRRVEASDDVIRATAEHADAQEEQTRKQGATGGILGGLLNRFGIQTRKAGENSEWLGNQLVNLGWTVGEALISITKDIYNLQARGISAGDSLFSLYGKAIKAGMSLEEYTSMLEENSAAVVRARSFDDFQDSLNRSVKSLNQLGVFGPAANQLAASLATSAVTLGVPQSQLADSTAAQVKMFEHLRKTTLMTADGFKELVQTISSNQNVQEDLLGMAPAEREARRRELFLTGSLGQQMGLTQEASRSLTDALLAQRKATAQERFQASGLIRQAGAMVGMGGAETEELANLRRKKRRTPEEEKRFVELSGVLEEGLQRMMNTGNIQAEFMAEQMSEKLGSTPQGQIQQIAGQARLQGQAGPVENADIGKETSPTMQGIGNALTTLSGFMKNPLADAMVIFGSMAAQTLIQSVWLSKIYGALTRRGRTPATSASIDGPDSRTTSTRGRRAPRKPGILNKFGAFMATTTASAAGINLTGARGAGEIRERGIGDRIARQNAAKEAEKAAKAAKVARGDTLMTRMMTPIFGKMFGMGALDSINFNAAGDLIPPQAQKTVISKIGDGMKTGFKTLMKGGPLAAAFGFFEELFTGEMTQAMGFGDGFGSRLLGAVVAGVNSLFTGFTRLFDDGVNWVMEGLGLSFRMNLTKLFDVATSYLVDGVKLVLAGLVKTLAAGLEFFGFKDAPWVKSLKDTEEKLYESIAKSSATREELMETEGATLRSMGENQIKAQKDIEKKSKGLTTATVSNVAFGVDALADVARRQVAASQATPTSSGTQQIATPGPTKQSAVTPPEVNKTQVEEEKKDKAAEKKADAAPNQTDLLTVAQLQLDVLRQMLAFWMSKEDVEDVLGRIQNRPAMESGSVLFNRALGR